MDMHDLAMCRSIALAVVAVLLGGCEKPIDNSGTFTLTTGVSVLSADECAKGDEVVAPTLEKDGADYIVSMKDFFDCDDDVKQPYLTATRDKKATLVIGAIQTKNAAECDCARVARIKISDRLEAGETLYVLRGKDVIGHLDAPVEK
jgi:hypothetical protein